MSLQSWVRVRVRVSGRALSQGSGQGLGQGLGPGPGQGLGQALPLCSIPSSSTGLGAEEHHFFTREALIRILKLLP